MDFWREYQELQTEGGNMTPKQAARLQAERDNARAKSKVYQRQVGLLRESLWRMTLWIAMCDSSNVVPSIKYSEYINAKKILEETK